MPHLQLALQNILKALLVVAHPDDETMFFSPTLLHLLDRACRVHVLCLSSGNHDGLGRLREKELIQACTILGDGPSIEWPPDIIASTIAQKAADCQSDTIITFDAKGVSQHPNHIAVWKGVITGESASMLHQPTATSSSQSIEGTPEPVCLVQETLHTFFQVYICKHPDQIVTNADDNFKVHIDN